MRAMLRGWPVMAAPTPRPTVYAGIRMRSRLEASYAQHLDRSGIKWEYEPQCFAGPAGQWLPDFKEVHPDTAYVEVKPAERYDETKRDAWSELSAILRRMEVTWLSEPGALLILVLWDYERGAVNSFHAWQGEPWQVRVTEHLTVSVELAEA